MFHAVKFDGCGKATAAGDTPITVLCKPYRGLKPRVSKFAYTPGATTHTLTAMRPLGKTTISEAAAAAQATIVLAADPGPAGNLIAANDYLVIQGQSTTAGRTWHVGVVSNRTVEDDGTVTVVLTANVPTGGFAAGALVWFLGVVGDGHPQYTLATGAQRIINDDNVGFIGTDGAYEPLLLHVNNITNAGVLDYATWGYLSEELGGGAAAVQPEGDDGSDPSFDAPYPEGYHLSSPVVQVVDPENARKTEPAARAPQRAYRKK